MEVEERCPESQSNHGTGEGSRTPLDWVVALVVLRTPVQHDQEGDPAEEQSLHSDDMVVALAEERTFRLRLHHLVEDLEAVHIALLGNISFAAFAPLEILVPVLKACPNRLRFSFDF